MRKFIAWGLLLATLLYLVGNGLSLEVMLPETYVRQMNKTESVIADSIERETGIKVNVVLLSDSDLVPRGISYSSFFVFSKEINGELYFYTIDSDPVKVIGREKIALMAGGDACHHDNAWLLTHILTKFQKTDIVISHEQPALRDDHIAARNAMLPPVFSPTIPTPPPEPG